MNDILSPGRKPTKGTSLESRKQRPRVLDILINTILVLTLGLYLLSFRFPILSRGLYALGGVYKYPTVKAGQLVSHDFTIRNLHPWWVTITGVTSSCGCTTGTIGKIPPFRLAPLQSITVKAAMQTSGRQGHVAQTVYVLSNDSSLGTPLILQGDVQEGP